MGYHFDYDPKRGVFVRKPFSNGELRAIMYALAAIGAVVLGVALLAVVR